MRFPLILSSFVFGVVASAQQPACPVLPTKPPVPAVSASLSPNQAAMAAAAIAPRWPPKSCNSNSKWPN